MKRIFGILICLVCFGMVHAQVTGVVLDDQGDPLVGANVWWAGTTVGVATNIDGEFSLPPVRETRLLVSSYMGYRNDTTEVHSGKPLTIVLINDMTIDQIDVVERKSAVIKSRVDAVNMESLTGQELCKAACCNLSESFETSASVDVSYADAATGAKQIRLLGLSGTYVQMLTENTPNIRGLAQSFGMEYIPGPWMQGIQVSKGTSSVVNGYEALTGQINVDYLHPHVADSLAINALISKDLKAELNLTGGWKVNQIAQTALLVHAQGNFLSMDDNHDGMKDMPTGYHLNILNRWGFKKGIWGSKLLVRGLYDQRIGGQMGEAKSLSTDPYLIDLRTRRIDGFWKNGLTFDKYLNQSLGLIASVSYHDQTNIYGPKVWNASQWNAYFNAIFQTDIDDWQTDPDGKHKHQISCGASVNYDKYNEQINILGDLSRDEVTSGIFAEYTYSYKESVTMMIGIREDYSNRYGFFTTPRMNIRYSPTDWWTLRASVGLGHRSPNLLADNAAYLSSNRTWIIPSQLAQETALNAGATMTFYIPIGKRELQLTGEYYYTQFLDGVITDVDRDQYELHLLNLKETPGARSFAHNWQVEANMEVLRGWTWTLAFRYTDVEQTTWNTDQQELILRERPLQNRFKGLITTSYQTPLKKWQFDFTAQFNGMGRMPDWFELPGDNNQYYQKGGAVYHTWYPQLLGQVTKYFRHASIYLGAENMTNFTQKNPILGDKMSGTTFVDTNSRNYDAAMVWAPIHGWKLYLGFRWNLEKD